MIAAHYASGTRGLLFRGLGELPDNASHGASPVWVLHGRAGRHLESCQITDGWRTKPRTKA
jgi:hypothetical protein